MGRRLGIIAGAILACALAQSALAAGVHPAGGGGPEAQLLRVLTQFQHGDISSALLDAQRLVAAEPNFRLAQLVYGDLLASRTGAPMSLDANSGFPRESVDGLMAEARQRWRRQGLDPAGKSPLPLLKMSPDQEHVVLVDTAISRLFLFENRGGEAELIADYYISAGKNGTHKEREGDRRTPIGVYFVTERLPGAALPDKYGPVAFPVDYPNEWDERHGRTGNGIWVHGVASSTYSRPPQDSDGCVALANDDLESIAPLLRAGSTPVVIGEHVRWLDDADVDTRRNELEQLIDTWRLDWQSGDAERYLEHYADDFAGRGMNKAQWASHKRMVTANKKFIKVGVSNLSIFAYPGEDDLVLARFRQSYQSDTFNGRSSKRQYWRRGDDGRWQIIAEEIG